MALSAREKYMVAGVGGAAAVFVLYSAVIGPFIARGNEIAVQRARSRKVSTSPTSPSPGARPCARSGSRCNPPAA